jgi:hypothetical protein
MAYVFSSTKLEKRVEKALPGSEGGGRKRRGWEGGKGVVKGRNGPNNVCTY